MRSSNVRALAEVLLLPQQGREGSTTTMMTPPRIWFHSSCLTSTGAGAGEEVDKNEFASIAGHVKAIYDEMM